MLSVEHILQPCSARQLVVRQRRIGRIDGQQSGLVHAQAEIQVVVDDFVRFIEAAERSNSSRRINMQAPVTAMTLRWSTCQAEIARFVRRAKRNACRPIPLAARNMPAC